MRLPLAMAIVFQHSYSHIGSAKTAEVADTLTWHALDWMRGFFSWTINGSALMAFGLIAGYLFFQHWNEHDSIGPIAWSWKRYGEKMYRRLFSLLLPYIVWNLLTAWYKHVPLTWNIFWDYHVWGQDAVNVFGLPLCATYAPIDSPFWFVRDLFLISLCAPIIYPIVRYGGIWSVVLALVMFVLKIPHFVPSLTLLPMYIIGAYLSVHRMDLGVVARKIWHPVMWIVVLCSWIVLKIDGLAFDLINPVVRVVLCIFYFYSATLIAEKKPWNTPVWVAEASIVIYAGHVGLGVLNQCAQWAKMLIPDSASGGMLALRYFLAPMLCIGLFLIAYRLIYPSFLAKVLSGKCPPIKMPCIPANT